MKAFLKSFVYAANGIIVSIRYHRNFKIQLAAALLTVSAGFYFNINRTDWCIILLTIALVLALEMINTAIENLVDLVTLERNPLAGKIKDIAAGAVLTVSFIAVVVGLIVFGKYVEN